MEFPLDTAWLRWRKDSWHARMPHLARPGARAAWRLRVARVGSLIQLAFAAFWLARGVLASSFPLRVPLALTLVVGVCAMGVLLAIRTARRAPRPVGPDAAALERAITLATVLQLAASVAFPVLVSMLGRPDLAVTVIAVTIGLLLLWLGLTLGALAITVAGVLLVGVPIALALVLAGDALTLVSSLATGGILVASGMAGLCRLAGSDADCSKIWA